MLWKEREQFMEKGRPRSQEMTVTGIFTDIKGFTTTSERMTPQELIDWLNTYMESMAAVIMDHRGVIDNYVGDAIKADFGVPIPRTTEEAIREDAQNAVDCALAMEKKMHQLNEEWEKQGLPPTGLRIGIHTGTVVAGLLGSSERMKYTTLGDAVNTASRLESLDKSIGQDLVCRILISEKTRSLLEDRYLTEPIGEVSLKGKEEKIVVHRVLGKN
jgi:adenylate cyclase